MGLNISNESLKLLENVIKYNPKHHPKRHALDYNRWIEFVICNYKNEEYIELGDLYNYLIDNGYHKHKEEALELVRHYSETLNFISKLNDFKYDGYFYHIRWLVEHLNK